MSRAYIKPFPEQACIGIVGLSSAALDQAEVEQGIAHLNANGFRTLNFYNHAQHFQRFAATETECLTQLYGALEHPEVDLILALRGGYGLSRLLHLLDYRKIAESGKLIAGYSDVTILQLALFAKEGMPSLSGPCLINDFSRETLNTYTQDQWLHCLKTRSINVEFPTDCVDNLELEGPLWGGNLAACCHLLGTPFFPHIAHIEGGILFLEDVAEHPYRIERMLLQLYHAGVLQKQKALVLGQFSAYRLAPHDQGYDFDEMVKYLRGILAIPIITGLPFGHVDEKACLMQGALTKLTVKANRVNLLAHF